MTAEENAKSIYLSDGCETWADLQIAYTKDEIIRRQLQRLKESRKNYRPVPRGDRQLDIFTPALSDISTKDDISLMDIALYSLDKKIRYDSLHYQLKDAQITVTGSNEYGLATIHDYDLVLYMISHLAYEMEQVKKMAKDGKDAPLPSRRFAAQAASLLKFCRREEGGGQYKALEQALLRLKFTGIVIQQDNAKSFRRTGTFSYINDFFIVGRTRTGNISSVIIDIPQWIYDGIVRPEKPTVLTLHNDYFLLSEGLHRFLHRFARKTAGQGSALYSVEQIYEQCSSRNKELRYFRRDLKAAIARLREEPLPDYDVVFVMKGRGKTFVEFTYVNREKTGNAVAAANAAAAVSDTSEEDASKEPVLKEGTFLLAKEAAPGLDIRCMHQEWLQFWHTKGRVPLKLPDKAFIRFCEKRFAAQSMA
jgi:plasmid replication initiation protein